MLEKEVQRLQERLNIEERFRTDTEVRHFKEWLRTHDQPQDSNFAQRFLVDGQLPEHASRGMYGAKLRRAVSGYSEEDIHLALIRDELTAGPENVHTQFQRRIYAFA